MTEMDVNWTKQKNSKFTKTEKATRLKKDNYGQN